MARKSGERNVLNECVINFDYLVTGQLEKIERVINIKNTVF